MIVCIVYTRVSIYLQEKKIRRLHPLPIFKIHNFISSHVLCAFLLFFSNFFNWLRVMNNFVGVSRINSAVLSTHTCNGTIFKLAPAMEKQISFGGGLICVAIFHFDF